jgi:hypothetical protein
MWGAAVSWSNCLITAVLTNNCDDQDVGGDYFVWRDTDRQGQRAVAHSKPSATASASNHA